jgi:hypothetical protein
MPLETTARQIFAEEAQNLRLLASAERISDRLSNNSKKFFPKYCYIGPNVERHVKATSPFFTPLGARRVSDDTIDRE